ncbi:pyrroline-5-carboxylate reductase family protein [Rickettsiella massiliensis]|uniref:pyrroline-5-carboxylate reductase family protein n=1 Tax=Rickettsiella massiliensis TaxID=676517 RepID=UPI00029A5C69|nr:NAD(P)-binding domain-containing protein [Rickettsiella massiliensis]
MDRPVLDNLEQHGVNVHQDNRHVAEQVDVLIFAVKPQVLYAVMSEVALISVAAGVSLHTLQSNLQIADAALIRSMPNTPTQFGCGMTGLIANPFCSEGQKN